MTLQEQLRQLKEAVEEANILGAKVNSFTTVVMNEAQQQLETGDETPLSTARWRAYETQKKTNDEHASRAVDRFVRKYGAHNLGRLVAYTQNNISENEYVFLA